VLERIWMVAYRLKLPATSKIHPMFHVSLLKKAIGDYKSQTKLPRDLEREGVEIIELLTILASCNIMKQGERVNQWLIHWDGKSVEDSTWEDEIVIRSQFLNIRLEDKPVVEGSDIDGAQHGYGLKESLAHEGSMTPKVWKVYEHKRKKQNVGS